MGLRERGVLRRHPSVGNRHVTRRRAAHHHRLTPLGPSVDLNDESRDPWIRQLYPYRTKANVVAERDRLALDSLAVDVGPVRRAEVFHDEAAGVPAYDLRVPPGHILGLIDDGIRRLPPQGHLARRGREARVAVVPDGHRSPAKRGIRRPQRTR